MSDDLNPEVLIERARCETGLRDFDSESFRDGLCVLTSEARRSDRLIGPGRAALAGEIVRNLSLRLKVADYIRQHPEAHDEKIERPVIVLGAPRTGTTLTSNLLACDPARRSLLDWITKAPVPPPTIDTLTTDPRALAQLEEERKRLAENPKSGSIYRASAVYPTECIFVMHSDFKTLAWDAFLPMPGYHEFMMSCDMSSAYDYHKLFLKMLQSRAEGAWNLKMPSHSLHIRWMLQAYPDARIVWTHRDPYTAMGSLLSLITGAESAFTGGNPDHDFIRDRYPVQIAAHIDRMLAMKQARPDLPIYDLHYASMTRDPIGEMRKLYAYLGDAFTPEAEAGMRAWLAVNPQGKYGQHEYNLERFGHSEASLKPYFEDYLSKIDVEREGV